MLKTRAPNQDLGENWGPRREKGAGGGGGMNGVGDRLERGMGQWRMWDFSWVRYVCGDRLASKSRGALRRLWLDLEAF